MRNRIVTLVVFGILASSVHASPTVDLTTAGSTGQVGSAIFTQFTLDTSAGTGVLNPFLQIKKSNQSIVQGYNSDYTPYQYNETTWSRALLLSEIPTVEIASITYREFILDINENSGQNNELLSLDDLEIYVSASNTLHDFPFDVPSEASLVYEFGDDDWIKLNYVLAPGSGKSDMVGLIPGFESYDPDTTYVYLYSKFGAQGDGSNGLGNTDGFEEWSVRVGGDTPIVPAPGAILLGGIGVSLVGWLKRRKSL